MKKAVTFDTREMLKRSSKDLAKRNIGLANEDGENLSLSEGSQGVKGSVLAKKNPREPIVNSLAEDRDLDHEKHFKN